MVDENLTSIKTRNDPNSLKLKKREIKAKQIEKNTGKQRLNAYLSVETRRLLCAGGCVCLQTNM